MYCPNLCLNFSWSKPREISAMRNSRLQNSRSRNTRHDSCRQHHQGVHGGGGGGAAVEVHLCRQQVLHLSVRTILCTFRSSDH
ncbi:hypothetical protein PVAP13_3NG236900 [Panicum virgatum]|uniref:Uncharacterized protein n=1 Tax=Panicum virgatum TaxID=38727 RepID=A0A8T0UKK3_PANVG|nr:hypothetical protein PVAP13_3NG236900 [Panicum virgatum]